MKCDICGRDFEEKYIDDCHVLPKYMGGTDLNGKFWACKECHGKYEWQVVKFIWDSIPKDLQEKIKDEVRKREENGRF